MQSMPTGLGSLSPGLPLGAAAPGQELGMPPSFGSPVGGALFPASLGLSPGHGLGSGAGGVSFAQASAPAAALSGAPLGMQPTLARPASEAKTPQIRVTEADRVSWMRKFLTALEQWKTCLDSLHAGGDADVLAKVQDGPPAVSATAAATGAAGALQPAGDNPDTQQLLQPAGDNLAVHAAAAQAQQAQMLQQLQFWQQMRMHEAQRTAKSAGGSGQGPLALALMQSSTRFKDSFRPMRICKHLVTLGFCRQGEQCTFAHTFEELHLSSPDLPKDDRGGTSALAEMGISNTSGREEDKMPDLRLKKKKELCDRFKKGLCSLGKVCAFAHGEEELGTVGLAVCGKVKTQICKNWEAGRCIYGAYCNNAHGEQELGTKRPPPELAPPMKRNRKEESDATEQMLAASAREGVLDDDG
mmetsp:Transcript_72534/g.132860  ORF Transcript_72534/g.132860 Transcript_72534/m.132860 type:complete len:414 (-) Transcript_72534:109-1350(-)